MTRALHLAARATVVTGFLIAASTASATPFELIRIGDVDGFGYTPAVPSWKRATPAHLTPADTNGNGVLEVTEFLPDRNLDGAVATGSGDDFDYRSAAEKADIVAPSSQFTDLGSSGSKWTDVALSTSSTLPDFPDPGGPGVPNEPFFIFNFNVAGADISTSASLFFNVLFGDYDVVPANITLDFASAPTRTLTLVTQPGAADGLIQASFATLLFSEVFTADGAGGWNGYLRVDFNAPVEPYLAFDFTELSTRAITVDAVPEPASIALFATGGLALAVQALRRRRAARR